MLHDMVLAANHVLGKCRRSSDAAAGSITSSIDCHCSMYVRAFPLSIFDRLKEIEATCMYRVTHSRFSTQIITSRRRYN